jgi:hypothetical protein
MIKCGSVPSSVQFCRRLGGLLIRRERWGFSSRGRLLVVLFAVLALWASVHGLYPFLCVNDGGAGDILVVEGWISTRRVGAAAEAFRSGHYQGVVVVRNVAEGNKWESGRYTADWMAADLAKQGVPTNVIHVIFCPVVRKDRTYSCAVAVREWLEQNHVSVESLDVATVAAHTRRSRLIYRKAFGNEVEVGTIAMDDPGYDPAHWWRTSEGIREVPFEALAYLYARFFFSPADREN